MEASRVVSFMLISYVPCLLKRCGRSQHEAGSKQGSSVPKMFFRVAVDFQRTTGRHIGYSRTGKRKHKIHMMYEVRESLLKLRGL
jgi:hypothetical protein